MKRIVLSQWQAPDASPLPISVSSTVRAEMRTLALLLAFLAAATTARAGCAADVIALRQALAFEPAALATQNARKGDLRFFEVGRSKKTVPGVQDQHCVRAGRLSVRLPGTTDVPCSKEHKVLNERAHGYAQQYNEAIARFRIEQALPTCGGR